MTIERDYSDKDLRAALGSSPPLEKMKMGMNLNRLYEILGKTTQQYRKGEVRVNGAGGTEIYAMPHESEAEALELVDLEFIKVGVDKNAAEKHKSELVELLKDYPRPDRLEQGPSYIEVGGEIGDQGAAFQLFALGKVLGLWDLITPTSMGFDGSEARALAGAGYVMIAGYPKQVQP